MGRPSNPNLSQRQALFVRHYLSGLTASESARLAGYSKKSAGRILEILSVKNAVEEEQTALRAVANSTAQKAAARCEELIRFAYATGNANAAVKAHDLFSRLMGYMIERIQVVKLDLRAALTQHQREVLRLPNDDSEQDSRALPAPVNPFE